MKLNKLLISTIILLTHSFNNILAGPACSKGARVAPDTAIHLEVDEKYCAAHKACWQHPDTFGPEIAARLVKEEFKSAKKMKSMVLDDLKRKQPLSCLIFAYCSLKYRHTPASRNTVATEIRSLLKEADPEIDFTAKDLNNPKLNIVFNQIQATAKTFRGQSMPVSASQATAMMFLLGKYKNSANVLKLQNTARENLILNPNKRAYQRNYSCLMQAELALQAYEMAQPSIYLPVDTPELPWELTQLF